MSKEQTPICKCGNKAFHTYESLSKPKQVSLCEKCNETRAENLIKGHNYVLKMKRTADELLDHYCSYNGIQDENKNELLSIVNAKVLEALERDILDRMNIRLENIDLMGYDDETEARKKELKKLIDLIETEVKPKYKNTDK